MNYKVSIIIPTYKRSGEFLIRAIESVLNQTYKNIEIIVVDDNVPNSEHRLKTEESMQKYKDNERVRYLKNKKNLGGSLARNEGIAFSTGDFITFLDDDDLYLPEKVEKQVKFMVENEFEMTFTDLKIHNSKDNLVDYREYNDIPGLKKELLLKYHLMRHITGTPTFMYESSVIKKIGCFTDSKMGQEFYLMLNTINNDVKIGYLPTSDVIAFRHNGEGISMGKNKISGEKSLYKFKKKYFYLFKLREKMFVRFRHHIVMGIAWKRNGNLFLCMIHILFAILCSPIDMIKESYKFMIKMYSSEPKISI